MNVYITRCIEPTGCYEFVEEPAESFDAAITRLRELGWTSVMRDFYGNDSLCPKHASKTAEEGEGAKS